MVGVGSEWMSVLVLGACVRACVRACVIHIMTLFQTDPRLRVLRHWTTLAEERVDDVRTRPQGHRHAHGDVRPRV